MQIKIKKGDKVYVKDVEELSEQEALKLIRESQAECFKIIKQIEEKTKQGFTNTANGQEWLEKATLSKTYFLKLIKRLKVHIRKEPVLFKDISLEDFAFVCKRLLPDDKLKALIFETKHVMDIKTKFAKEQEENNKYIDIEPEKKSIIDNLFKRHLNK